MPFVSCGGGEETPNILKIGSRDNPTTNNPFAANMGSNDAIHFQMLYEPLAWNKYNGEIGSALASDWSYDEATMTWTFNIDPDAKFSDGTQVTAADAKWTLDKYIELGSGRTADLAAVLFETDPITAEDATTLKIKLNEFAAAFLGYMGSSYILPKSVWEGMTNDALLAYENASPVGSGPYALEEREAGSHVIYSAREDYWGGAPNIDTVQIVQFENDEALLLALKVGDIDTLSQMTLPGAVAQVVDIPEIKVFSQSVNKTMTLYLNHRIEPWNLKSFRQAVSIAINRLNLIGYVAQGWADMPVMLERSARMTDVANHPQYESVLKWQYEDMTQEERVDAANAALDAITGMSQTPDPIPEGWVRTYNGDPVEFTYEIPTMTAHTTSAELIAQDLASIGIKANVSALGVGTFIGKTFRQKSSETAANWDMFTWDRTFNVEFDDFARYWSQYAEDDPSRFGNRGWISGWSGSAAESFDTKADQLRALPVGDTTRNSLIEEAMVVWAQEIPAIPIYHNIDPGFHRTDKFTGWQYDQGVFAFGSCLPMISILNTMNLEPI